MPRSLIVTEIHTGLNQTARAAKAMAEGGSPVFFANLVVSLSI